MKSKYSQSFESKKHVLLRKLTASKVHEHNIYHSKFKKSTVNLFQ